MLSNGEIAAMRDTAAGALPDRAIIQQKQKTSDGGGGFTEDWSNLAMNVPCRLDPIAGGERAAPGSTADVGDRPADESTHVVTFRAGQDLEEVERILIDGQIHEVALVRKRSAWELTRRVEVREAP